MIKVLVVDDSGFMRLVLKKMIQDGGGDMVVVGEARDGAAAVAMAKQLRPDVITMDVEMPGLNGIDATRQIMAESPCAIIMVSSLMASGAVPTIQALEAGAVDFIAKKSSFVQLDIVQIGEQLLEKIRFFGLRSVQKTPTGLRSSALPGRTLASAPATPRFNGPAIQPASSSGLLNAVSPPGRVGLVVVASSTGGPAVMQDFLKGMGQIGCPVVIAQHMPALFTKGFADHMRRETQLNVIEGTDGLLLEPGMVVVTPGGTDSVVREPFTGKLNFYLKTHDNVPIHPNADVLFRSAASLSVNSVGVIMTGMGSDGTEGAKALHGRKAPILAQEPSTCVVDGMPGSAIAAGVVCRSLPPKELGQQLSRWCSR